MRNYLDTVDSAEITRLVRWPIWVSDYLLKTLPNRPVLSIAIPFQDKT